MLAIRSKPADAFVKKASRRGRYRKALLSPQDLVPHAQTIAAVLSELDCKRQQAILNDAEFASYALLTLLACRRADAFQPHRTRHAHNTMRLASAARFSMADFWKLLCSHSLPVGNNQAVLDQAISVYHFLGNIRFRGIPDAAQTALLKWLDKEYPLTLLFHIPSATDVFELQKQGGRCISFLIQANELTGIHHGRDAISFIVHDLIHAHEFYAIPQRAQQQIGFYHWLDSIQQHPLLMDLQKESTSFLAHWEYVLSDMNSYCGHLLKTLHAAFAIHADESLWNSVVEFSDLSSDEKNLFRKINSPTWREEDFLKLESILEQRYQTRHLSHLRVASLHP